MGDGKKIILIFSYWIKSKTQFEQFHGACSSFIEINFQVNHTIRRGKFLIFNEILSDRMKSLISS